MDRPRIPSVDDEPVARVSTLVPRALAGNEAEEGGESWAVQVALGGEWLPVSRCPLAQVREVLARAG
jgi:hypothetical protein